MLCIVFLKVGQKFTKDQDFVQAQMFIFITLFQPQREGRRETESDCCVRRKGFDLIFMAKSSSKINQEV